MSVPREILELSFSDLIKLLVSGKYTGDVLKSIHKRIRELWEEKKYGFTPEPELASQLQKISKQDAYLRLKACIGKHWSLDLIKLGLHIVELNDDGRRKLIEEIRGDVYRKHREKGIRILNIGSTGVIMEVIEVLSSIKMRHNLTQYETAAEFDKILERWYDISIFTQTTSSKGWIEGEVIKHMDLGLDLFFVFAYGHAGRNAAMALAELNNEKLYRKKGYLIFLSQHKKDRAGKDAYTWVFTKTHSNIGL